MRRRTLWSAGVLVPLVTALAAAQRPAVPPPVQQPVSAWFVTAHVKARALDLGLHGNPGPIEWASIRTLRWGSATRIDFTPDSTVAQWGGGGGQILPVWISWLSPGRDTTKPIVVLDSAQKKYYIPTLHSGFPGMGIMRMPRGPGDTMPSPNDPVSRIVQLTVHIDSLGSGPVIRGHATLHYRQTQRTTIETTLGEMTAITIKIDDQQDLDIATDIRNAPPIDGQGVQRVAGFFSELATTPQLAAAIQASPVHYPRGLILHLDDRQTIGSIQGPQSRLMSMDIDHWGTTDVDPARFTIPTSYTLGDWGFLP